MTRTTPIDLAKSRPLLYAAVVRAMMAYHGHTVKSAAVLCGVSESTVMRARRGTGVRPVTVRQLAPILTCSIVLDENIITIRIEVDDGSS